MVEKSASPIPKTPEVQKSDTKQEIIDETDDDEEDIPLKKIVKSKKAQSLKKTSSNANRLSFAPVYVTMLNVYIPLNLKFWTLRFRTNSNFESTGV